MSGESIVYIVIGLELIWINDKLWVYMNFIKYEE